MSVFLFDVFIGLNVRKCEGEIQDEMKLNEPKCVDELQMAVVCEASSSLEIAENENEKKYDETGHWPYQDEKLSASRCKRPNCKGFTHVFCGKCKRYLCFTRNRNCFVVYHTKN